MSPEAVALAARDWTGTATALLETADRLAALVPEAEDRLRGRTGDVAARALRDAVRVLRLDAADAAAGGTALDDVAAALAALRRDPSPGAQDLLALRMREATRVMRRIHGPATPPPPPATGATGVTAVGTGASGSVASGRVGPLPAPAGLAASALGAGLLTAARSPAPGPAPGGGRATGVPGTTNPAGRGRSGRDRGSRDRHAHPAGIEECWADDEGAGPAVLGAG